MPPIPECLGELGKEFTRQCLQKNAQDRPSAAQLLQHAFLTAPIEIETEMQSSEESNELDIFGDDAKQDDHELNDMDNNEKLEAKKLGPKLNDASSGARQVTTSNRVVEEKLDENVPKKKKLGCIADVKEIVAQTIEYENETRRALMAKQFAKQQTSMNRK